MKKIEVMNNNKSEKQSEYKIINNKRKPKLNFKNDFFEMCIQFIIT